MYKISAILVFIIISFISTQVFGQKHNVSKAEKTFEAFWTFFNENYAFFEDKNIDWKQTYQAYRPKVNAQTNDEELFTILFDMVKPLKDSHVSIATSDGKYYSATKPSRVKQEFKGYKLADYYAMIDSSLIGYGFKPMADAGPKLNGTPLFQYTSNDQYGYLRINRSAATGFYTTGSLPSLNKILKKLHDKKGLIIDLRFNPGGTDNFAFKIAGRFTEKEYLGHYKQVKQGSEPDEFTALKPYFVKPKGNTKFLKPVMLLTNDVTVSAADVLTLVIGELPQVTIIGENSNGSFSDRYPYLFPKKMPNGWKVYLSNQRYLSAGKVNYEGIGVPVDIEVRNMRADIETKKDPVLIRALEELEIKD